MARSAAAQTARKFVNASNLLRMKVACVHQLSRPLGDGPGTGSGLPASRALQPTVTPRQGAEHGPATISATRSRPPGVAPSCEGSCGTVRSCGRVRGQPQRSPRERTTQSHSHSDYACCTHEESPGYGVATRTRCPRNCDCVASHAAARPRALEGVDALQPLEGCSARPPLVSTSPRRPGGAP